MYIWSVRMLKWNTNFILTGRTHRIYLEIPFIYLEMTTFSSRIWTGRRLHIFNSYPEDSLKSCRPVGLFYQIRKIGGYACAGNTGTVFPTTDSKGNRELAIPTCTTARALPLSGKKAIENILWNASLWYFQSMASCRTTVSPVHFPGQSSVWNSVAPLKFRNG